MCFVYLFIDPINNKYSGITKYTEEALNFLTSKGVNGKVLAKDKSSSIDNFRELVKKECDQLKAKGIDFIVEAPESYASTILLSKEIKIHIRLHYSKIQSFDIEGDGGNNNSYMEELSVIKNAKFISAPSKIAALHAKRFFPIDNVHVYPNPFDYSNHTPITCEKYDIGFVGRWQNLKGVGFLERISDLGYDLAIQSNYCPSGIKRKRNVSFFNGGSKDKIYSKCKVIIIPSLFETSSMVLLEAIATGAKVVTWEHIGSCEFFNTPGLIKVKPFNIDSFIGAIDVALSSGIKVTESNIVSLDINNKTFKNGIDNILNERGAENINSFFFDKERHLLNNVLEGLGLVNMRSDEMTSFERKFRKLRKKPILFFSDMIKKKKGVITVPEKEATVKKLVEVKKSKRRRANLLFNIESTKVSFHDFKPKFKDYRTGVVFKKERFKSFEYKEIMEDIYSSNSDFWPLRRENLSRAYVRGDCLDFDWFKIIPYKEFSKLDNFRVLIVFDIFSSKLLEFLRGSSPNIKLILVSTEKNSSDIYKNIIDNIDCLITPEGYIGSEPRKIIEYAENKHIHLWVRKAVQEYLPKEHNFLLPIINADTYNPEIIDVNTDSNNVLIYRRHHEKMLIKPYKNATDYISDLSSSIESMYVDEVTYLSYKSLLDDKNISLFLSYALKDGVRISVR